MNQLPTGTVTFLFTDIEGSTKLWEQHPETMKNALARHDLLLRQAIEANNGYVFKTMGDAFCVVFPSAPEALTAALAAQRALQGEAFADAWPDSHTYEPANPTSLSRDPARAERGTGRSGDYRASPLLVRMALHTGAADERAGDYFGPALNRVARLLAAGHGGQTLISLTTQELVRDCLPPTASLLDLGEHRLKDLFQPERVFQLNVPDLPSEFPQLNTLDAKFVNLPAQSTSFIGRERELSALLSLLRRDDVRLVTLTGPGGTGKTRLSLQAAANLLDEYRHGVFFVPLATITDPDLVIPSIASVFNIKEAGGQSVEVLLKYYLAERHLLLLLDNLEQVLSAAPKLAELLSAAPQLKIIASSREKLRLYGEHEYPVPPLALPDLKMRRNPTIAVLSQYEAVALFLQRAKAANPNFEITEQNAPAVAELCVRLDGLPLAIELAAARARLLPPHKLLEKFTDRLKLLTGGPRDLPARQQTIRATIDWSYNLLGEDEKRLFARLGVFMGGWTLEAAEAVRSVKGILDGLESLADKSLIHPVESVDDEPRFTMLETLREYALEKLSESGEGGPVRDWHLEYFVNLAERAEPELTRQHQVAWLNRLQTELDNIRAALEWSLERRPEAGLRLASVLRWFWQAQGYFRDGSEWLAQLLSRPEGLAHTPARAKALTIRSWLVSHLGDARQGYGLAEESLSLYRELSDRRGAAGSLLAMGFALASQADFRGGRLLLEESVALYRALEDKAGLAEALAILGGFTDNQEYPRAKLYLEESLALNRASGNVTGIGAVMVRLGLRALRHGDYPLARARLEESLELSRSLSKINTIHALEWLGDLAGRQGEYAQARAYIAEGLALTKATGQIFESTWLLSRLGYVALRQGELAEARALFQESHRQFKELGNKDGIVFVLEGLASLAVRQGRLEQAVRLFGRTGAVREAISNTRPLIEQADVDQDLATIRSQLDEAAFEKAWAKGRAMTLDQAAAEALED